MDGVREHVFDPEIISSGGGLVATSEYFYPPARELPSMLSTQPAHSGSWRYPRSERGEAPRSLAGPPSCSWQIRDGGPDPAHPPSTSSTAPPRPPTTDSQREHIAGRAGRHPITCSETNDFRTPESAVEQRASFCQTQLLVRAFSILGVVRDHRTGPSSGSGQNQGPAPPPCQSCRCRSLCMCPRLFWCSCRAGVVCAKPG